MKKIHDQIESRVDYDSSDIVCLYPTTIIPRQYNSNRYVIVDIDGTLAKMSTDRGPFDWHKVGLDLPNQPVIDVVRSLYESVYHIVIVSGRSDICRDETMQWLYANHIPFQELHMRRHGDNRKDYIVKREIMINDIGQDNVAFVIDDRRQVVEMWRTHFGFTVFQVDKGDF